MNRHDGTTRRVHAFAAGCAGASAIALAGAVFVVPATAQDVAGQDSIDEPFIVFDRSHPLVPDDGVPMVQVFESGRVVVTRGPERTRSGRHEFELGADALARLRALAASGAAAAPPTSAEPIREIVDGQEVFTAIADPTTTTLRLRVRGTDGGVAVAGALPVVRVIEVEGLAGRGDALVRTTGIAALVDLERSLLDVYSEPVRQEQPGR